MSFPLQRQQIELQGTCVELFIPDAGAVKEAYEQGRIAFPYWSQVWPAAKAMAELIADHPEYTKAKRVIEVGAGLGLPSLVAARYAESVLCTDYVPEAVAIVQQSAAQAGLKNLMAEVLDWQQLSPNLETDVLLLSDINYEPSAFALLLNIVRTFLEKGTLVLLSTPQRLMAKDFIAPLLSFCTRQDEKVIMHEGKAVQTTVMVLEMK